MLCYMTLDLETVARYGPDIAGVDEVGMGPVAGPVCACALMVSREQAATIAVDRLEVDDSKKLSQSQRESLFPRIVAVSTHALGWVSVEEIEELRNLNKSGALARQRAVGNLVRKCQRLHRPEPAALISDWFDIPGRIPCVHVKSGDSLSFVCAAASIVAKVYRDTWMVRQLDEHPEWGVYNWADNKGYGTPQHLRAIEIHGTTPLHRKYLLKTRATGARKQKGWGAR